MSWLWRGFQSALFYYISCTPCAVRAQHRRTKQSNRREAKALSYAAEHNDPNSLYYEEGYGGVNGAYYTRTLPLQMNPHWAEERDEGPIPRRKGGGGGDHCSAKDKKEKEREKEKVGDSATRLNTGGQGSSFGASSAETGTTLVGDEGREGGGAGWGRHRRFQRADEVLWGVRAEHYSPSSSAAKNGESKRDRSRSRTKASVKSYAIGRNPAVNDMHPPIVSTQPTSKSETMWMLQPPPPAKVMAGKVKDDADGTRTRSATGGSKGSKTSKEVTPRAKRSRASSKGKPNASELSFQNFDEEGYSLSNGPSISVIPDPLSPTATSYNGRTASNDDSSSLNPHIDLTRASSSRSTAGEKSTKKASNQRPPLSTINSETNNIPKWLSPGEAERQQMENFRFPPSPIDNRRETMPPDVWRSEWDQIDVKDRDLSMRWSMDV